MRLSILSCCVAGFVMASLAGAQEKARTFSARLQEGGHKVAAEMGHYGGWLVQSSQRWDDLTGQLKALGVKLDDQLGGKVDFAKEDLACVFHYGDEGDKFSLFKVSGDDKSREAAFVMSYIIYKQRRGLTLGVWQMLAVPVPRSAAMVATVATYHPMNGGPHPTPQTARLAWRWTFGRGAGEAIGGLTMKIEPAAATVRAGEDILLRAALEVDQASEPAFDEFTRVNDATVHVWDNKYSNGYRNDAYEVIGPDGKAQIVRIAVINEWRKNIPRPVAIAPGKPYTLVNWVEGKNLKSLKERGLDTSKPGKYAITGIYQETGEPIQNNNPEMWGGIVRSNTVVVEVK